MVPPVRIVPRVLHYMKSQNAVGTVVLPFWPSAHYWPLLMNKYLKYISAYSMHIGNQSLRDWSKSTGGGGGWAGAFRNVVVRKHMTHPFQLEQNGVTHP